MFYDKNSEEPWNAFFFWSRKGGVMCAFFLEQKKRVKPCVVRNSFSAVLLQQKKKGTADNPGFFQ